MAWEVIKNTAKNVARFIGLEIISHSINPKRLITDGGPEMVYNSLNAYYAQSYVSLIVTTP